ncbi:hypothetical protein HYFRA_00012738 [Hymenoscyphus fraxineus]|uniref:Uncharacterized protein n=1 Tax=Hymenoscyphus fraxineus TaxID=746836 RepID=A0A9N9L4L2_9HELO|nr:hypothetical protein HYFRA_00012738 [Hymenoscyphus fraxineus]
MLVLNFLASVAVLVPLVSGAPIPIKGAKPNQQACHCPPMPAKVGPKSLSKRILGFNLGTDMITDNMLAVMGKGVKHKHTHAHVTLLQINVPGGCCGRKQPGSPGANNVPDSPFDTPKSAKAESMTAPPAQSMSKSESVTAPKEQAMTAPKEQWMSRPVPQLQPVPQRAPVPQPKPVSSEPWNWPVTQPKQKMDKRAVAEFIGGNILGKLGKSTAGKKFHFTLPHALGGVRKQKQPKSPKPKKEPKQKQKENGNQ